MIPNTISTFSFLIHILEKIAIITIILICIYIEWNFILILGKRRHGMCQEWAIWGPCKPRHPEPAPCPFNQSCYLVYSPYATWLIHVDTPGLGCLEVDDNIPWNVLSIHVDCAVPKPPPFVCAGKILSLVAGRKNDAISTDRGWVGGRAWLGLFEGTAAQTEERSGDVQMEVRSWERDVGLGAQLPRWRRRRRRRRLCVCFFLFTGLWKSSRKAQPTVKLGKQGFVCLPGEMREHHLDSQNILRLREMGVGGEVIRFCCGFVMVRLPSRSENVGRPTPGRCNNDTCPYSPCAYSSCDPSLTCLVLNKWINKIKNKNKNCALSNFDGESNRLCSGLGQWADRKVKKN